MNDQKGRSERGKRTLPIFLASGTFQTQCGLLCLLSNLGACFSPETMYMFSNCRIISRGLQQLSDVQRALSFGLRGTCRLLTSSAVAVFLIHPACATQDFREFSHSLLQSCLSGPKNMGNGACSAWRRGGHPGATSLYP